MTSKELLDAIGEIRDESILNAEIYRVSRVSHGKNFSKILLVAILILALTITAIAYFGASEIFKFFFTENNEEPLSELQEQFLDENALELGQSVTNDGWTVTLQSAITDQLYAYIKVDVEAPEGTELTEFEYSFDEVNLRTSEGGFPDMSYTGSQFQLPDEDGKSNTISIMIVLEINDYEEAGFDFTDSISRKLSLGNLYIHEEYDKKIISENTWDFDIVFSQNETTEMEKLEIMVEPITIFDTLIDNKFYDIEFHSFTLTPLGAHCEYEVIAGGNDDKFAFFNAVAVMTDGTEVKLDWWTGTIPLNSDTRTLSFRASSPMVLGEIAYVYFLNEVVLISPLLPENAEIELPIFEEIKPPQIQIEEEIPHEPYMNTDGMSMEETMEYVANMGRATENSTAIPTVVDVWGTEQNSYEIEGKLYVRLENLVVALAETEYKMSLFFDEEYDEIHLEQGELNDVIMLENGNSGEQTAVPSYTKLLLNNAEMYISLYQINDGIYVNLEEFNYYLTEF